LAICRVQQKDVLKMIVGEAGHHPSLTHHRLTVGGSEGLA